MLDTVSCHLRLISSWLLLHTLHEKFRPTVTRCCGETANAGESSEQKEPGRTDRQRYLVAKAHVQVFNLSIMSFEVKLLLQ